MKLTKDHPFFEKFLSLACRLSPENLTCDGECSPQEIKERAKQILMEWEELQEQIGFSVTEDDVYAAHDLGVLRDDGEIDPREERAIENMKDREDIRNEERDQFRSDAEADADALESAGFGEGERDFDERL